MVAVIKSKEPSEVAKVILDHWCLNGLGYPSVSFFCDNGLEFKGGLVEKIVKRTGIKVQLTASYSS